MTFARSPLLLLSALLPLAFVGCSGKTEAPAAQAATAPGPAASASAPAGAPATVSTVTAQNRDLSVTLKATGTVAPLTTVDVKSQVTSTVTQVHFKEGQFVKAGQVLFTLDARTDEANVAKARAQLAKDNASLADAKRQFERAQQLFTQNFISQGAVDTAQAQVEAVTATVAADQATIDATRVALSYSRITAPNAGRAGAVNVYPGSAVQANVTSLVTITQLDPIGVQFSIPQRNLGDALQALQGGGASVTATLADGGGTFKGRLQFVDSLVDASSGAVKAKAVFDNKDAKLWPGAFVEISQTVSTLQGAVVVPQAAIIQGARGTIVYVVEDGKAVLRPVKLVYAEAGDAAVTGIQAGDRVVLDGRQNLRPNAPVAERGKDAKDGKAMAQDATKPAAP
ncbi:efflux RND transporter periplasmic adaptor subunit [Rhodoferax saidenbachensis]|uniref:RND family efflux transporter MFP subunit n=1 Tax=Rhodoferax saidenbachensis TaxID=1484693 RepID=A0ABU1ZMN6_9BURK|nr:efflux RND transporter periplasmic adaptor subunit [Rhodoferax saidenbachensis]MDR7306807.1 RND family efflux transporter MFP subunit [Rhodoferax saidenbachensis]